LRGSASERMGKPRNLGRLRDARHAPEQHQASSG
jgi:hypothetical protein